MNCKLSFGVHKGKTFEWVFFNAPSYATWLYKKRILRTRSDYDALERDYFDELYLRASKLDGTCEICKFRPITRKAFYFYRSKCTSHRLCDTCEIQRLSNGDFSSLSMLDFGSSTTRHHFKVIHSLAEKYTGPKSVFCQEEMEQFFRKDSNFKDATPNFFSDWEKEVESS